MGNDKDQDLRKSFIFIFVIINTAVAGIFSLFSSFAFLISGIFYSLGGVIRITLTSSLFAIIYYVLGISCFVVIYGLWNKIYWGRVVGILVYITFSLGSLIAIVDPRLTSALRIVILSILAINVGILYFLIKTEM